MDASGLDEEALLASVAAGGEAPKAEVLLPEVVAAMVAKGDGLPGAGHHHRRQADRRHPRRRPAGGERRAGPSGGLGHPAQPALDLTRTVRKGTDRKATLLTRTVREAAVAQAASPSGGGTSPKLPSTARVRKRT